MPPRCLWIVPGRHGSKIRWRGLRYDLGSVGVADRVARRFRAI